ncbi:MAG: c-type cytochrome, partial [Planctomycetes bacterium]|nr:c-type cytochrome [Planctomycetota bacterium]
SSDLLVERYRAQLAPEVVEAADAARGRQIFGRTCAACHRLFDEGRKVGPELTGSQRRNVDYILENVLDPNAAIGRDYQVTTVITDAGRTISGIIAEETERSLTIHTQNETVVVPKDAIEDRRQQNVSMMPEGIVEKLSLQELRDLVKYLKSEAPPRD